MTIVTKDNIKLGMKVCILPQSEYFRQQRGEYGIIAAIGKDGWCDVAFNNGEYVNRYRYDQLYETDEAESLGVIIGEKIHDLYIHPSDTSMIPSKNSLSGLIIEV